MADSNTGALTPSTEKGAPREPGECGTCDRPEQFDWDPIRWEDGAPVMVCNDHSALAPGWAYHLDAPAPPPGKS